MSQSRRHSLEEVVVSTMVGLAVSTLLNQTVVPIILNTEVSAAQNIAMTIIFTVASLVRSYVLRRVYNGRVA